MSNQTSGIIILSFAILLFVAIIVLTIRYVRKVNKRKIQFHIDLAQRLNLTHSTSKYLMATLNRMEGERNGMGVVIYEEIVGSGKNQVLYTKIAIEPTPFNFDFSIGKEGFFNKISRAVGVKDIEFGNVEFDKMFLLKSKEESQFRTLMDYRAQGELTRIAPSLRGIISNNATTFGYVFAGGFTKEQHTAELEEVLKFMEMLIKNKRS